MGVHNKGWYGVDLDGTLAMYDGWQGSDHIGEPIPSMLKRVISWLSQGQEVRIFTARVYPLGLTGDFHALHIQAAEASALAIDNWCVKYVGQKLKTTCVKDFSMIEHWDDRSIQIIPNTGQRADGKP
jgi:hypothetical protein